MGRFCCQVPTQDWAEAAIARAAMTTAIFRFDRGLTLVDMTGDSAGTPDLGAWRLRPSWDRRLKLVRRASTTRGRLSSASVLLNLRGKISFRGQTGVNAGLTQAQMLLGRSIPHLTAVASTHHDDADLRAAVEKLADQ